MERYLNRSGNSPIAYYQIADTSITIWFGTKPYRYSYGGRAGKMHVDNMKGLARSGSGLSAYITRNVRNDYD
jgi:hypothetical protein